MLLAKHALEIGNGHAQIAAGDCGAAKETTTGGAFAKHEVLPEKNLHLFFMFI